MFGSPNAKALHMSQTLADFYKDNPSPEGDEYLREWNATRPSLIQAVAVEDGRTVEMRQAAKAFKKQKRKLEEKLLKRKHIASFNVIGLEGGQNAKG